MKALISPLQDNFVVQVVNNNNTFPVAEPLYWIDCSESIKAYEFKYKNLEFIEYQPIQKIPTTVSMRQARLALLQVNMLSQIEIAIASGSQADKITWEYATEVNRSDALVINMSAALGLSEAQLDALFTLAAGL